MQTTAVKTARTDSKSLMCAPKVTPAENPCADNLFPATLSQPSLMRDGARRTGANIAKLPVLLHPQSDSGTAEFSGRCQAFSRSFELGYFDFGFRS
jgi:hypothetical protein